MTRDFILSVLLLMVFNANAQTQDTVRLKISKLSDTKYELEPRLNNMSLMFYLDEKIPVPDNLPLVLHDAVVALHVDSNGLVSDVRLFKSFSPVVDKSILSVFDSLPILKPALFNGHNVSADLAISIIFIKMVYNGSMIKTAHCVIYPPMHLNETNNREQIFSKVQTEPSFPGGSFAFGNFVKKNLVYPPQAKAKHIQGKVLLGVVINKNGSISEMKILSSPDEDLSKEVLRIMHMCPNFIPGMQNGTLVNCRYILPFTFNLADDN